MEISPYRRSSGAIHRKYVERVTASESAWAANRLGGEEPCFQKNRLNQLLRLCLNFDQIPKNLSIARSLVTLNCTFQQSYPPSWWIDLKGIIVEFLIDDLRT